MKPLYFNEMDVGKQTDYKWQVFKGFIVENELHEEWCTPSDLVFGNTLKNGMNTKGKVIVKTKFNNG